MSAFDDILAYFEVCATQLRAVSHPAIGAAFGRFGTYEPDEIVSGLRSKLDLRGEHLVLLVERPEEAYDDNGADGQWTQHRIGFVLMRQCELENFAQQNAAQNDARAAGQQLAARIRRDARTGQFLLATARLTDNARFEVEAIGPAFDECYGARFVFSWCEPGVLRIDPAAWN